MVGDTVFDSVSEQEVKILGTYYCNGKNPFNSQNHFHQVVYYVNSDLFDGVRQEEQLEKIFKNN